jgi:FkbM family methyltransferase
LLLQNTLRTIRAGVARQLVSPWAVKALEPITRHRVRHLGTTISTDLAIFSPYTRAELFWGLYERAECVYIDRYIHGSDRVLELGGGLGVSSAHIAAGLAPRAQLLCVEANPAFVPAIERNVVPHVRRLNLRARVLNAALAADADFVHLRTDDNPFASHVTARRPSEGRDGVIVPSRSLSSLIKELSSLPYDLVCDIEGAEAAFILGGDDDGLAECRRLVIEVHRCSLHGKFYTADDLLDVLRNRWGFQLLECKGPVAALAHG